MHDQALSLLTTGRVVLVEIGGVRYSARVARGPSAFALALEFLPPGPQPVPAVGDTVDIVVPVLHRGWRFRSAVLQPPAAGRVGLFELPERAEQHKGREAPRANVVLPLRCRSDDETWIATWALDLSTGGIRMAFPRAMEPAAPLSIELHTPEGIVAAVGAVAWQRVLHDQTADPMFMTGVQLSALSDDARHRVSLLVQRASARTRPDELAGARRAAAAPLAVR